MAPRKSKRTLMMHKAIPERRRFLPCFQQPYKAVIFFIINNFAIMKFHKFQEHLFHG
jgi:hypothetical protein